MNKSHINLVGTLSDDLRIDKFNPDMMSAQLQVKNTIGGKEMKSLYILKASADKFNELKNHTTKGSLLEVSGVPYSYYSAVKKQNWFCVEVESVKELELAI
jgi:hypothetical protein